MLVGETFDLEVGVVEAGGEEGGDFLRHAVVSGGEERREAAEKKGAKARAGDAWGNRAGQVAGRPTLRAIGRRSWGTAEGDQGKLFCGPAKSGRTVPSRAMRGWGAATRPRARTPGPMPSRPRSVCEASAIRIATLQCRRTLALKPSNRRLALFPTAKCSTWKCSHHPLRAIMGATPEIAALAAVMEVVALVVAAQD